MKDLNFLFLLSLLLLSLAVIHCRNPRKPTNFIINFKNPLL